MLMAIIERHSPTPAPFAQTVNSRAARTTSCSDSIAYSKRTCALKNSSLRTALHVLISIAIWIAIQTS